MKPKVVIAGGTGFIGDYLKAKFINQGYEVLIISRQNGFISWDDKPAMVAALNHSELVINLANKSVNCRYTKHNKEAIICSRVKTTRLLGESILECENPPKLWVNSSTATIYRHAEDRPMTEADGEIGTGFSVEVAKRWERAFFHFQLPKTRMVALRTAIVLGEKGGALAPYKNLVRLGLGGMQGNGKQMFSWIHEEDMFSIISFLQSNETTEGIYNCSAPNPISNKAFMRSLRKVMHMPFGLPSPEFLLSIGVRLIQTEKELILKSRWVLPERRMQEGFEFKFSTIENALSNILHSK
jgi:uncharacterized protein (TIGR01777 family)